MTDVLIQGKLGGRPTQGEYQVKMKAEIRVMLLQAKKHQRCQQTTRN